MVTEEFSAAVQYGDFRGTAQVDLHDTKDLHSRLMQDGLMRKGEFLVGIDVGSSVVGIGEDLLSVTVFLHEGDYDRTQAEANAGKPLPVRRVELEMLPKEFFGYFKRISIAISPRGMIDGREITYEETPHGGA
ncbi:hypothetical protein [Verminephrobacter aporrectodeae]|uniref:Uncharacterized protein n=1 Tax=Verminephrobacter aporrectodeae subsp. tuberculatae TaxID=1110392 RepID=A0ABT3KTM3_9BURK|nr:hypothetical protein [Verminephrobacter aporrectodeae]MCW5222650.1 hypothetical protein [Verminephrobacter aporrectodeae subsp. tuberculatae]MCW5257117.1 hypothetical protein [Verminephrobacter aporrectodeae subsp. tuberculatae]MCW5288114.1 hypothetical protein [Verminephrobacter aporrectodeae subsp. tuberculatae]MCW5321681.1 hypothetical protein [Verminephrobacter aporrectodeae subsp. tuberculatae]MCW8173810.1 hypothetical protein [Verminephrobacter aporrectodeae subsp. tuberculatae]